MRCLYLAGAAKPKISRLLIKNLIKVNKFELNNVILSCCSSGSGAPYYICMMNSVDDIARCTRRYARPSFARSLGKFGWSVRWLIFIVMYIDRWICDNATHRHHHSQTDKQRTSVFVVEKITKFVNFTYWMK